MSIEINSGLTEPEKKEIRLRLVNKKIRLTKNRILIYQILNRADEPLSVQEIECFANKLVKENGTSCIWMSSIYRTLDVFLEHDLVEQFIVPGKEYVVYRWKKEDANDHKHVAICTSCNSVIDGISCPKETWKDLLDEKKFHITGHKIEVYGLCEDCLQDQTVKDANRCCIDHEHE